MSSTAAIALSADTLGPRSLTSAVYERLRRDILSEQLLPGFSCSGFPCIGRWI